MRYSDRVNKTLNEDNQMIKIFTDVESNQIITDWAETNSITAPISSSEEATGLDLYNFPCIVKLDANNKVLKVFANSTQLIVNLTEQTMIELR